MADNRFKSLLGKFWPRLNTEGEPKISFSSNDGGIPTLDMKTLTQKVSEDSVFFEAHSKLQNSKNVLNMLLEKPLVDKGSYIKAVDEIKEYDLAEGIINNIAKDVMNKDVSPEDKKKFFKVSLSPEFKDLQAECQRVLDRFELPLLLKDYIDDILWYGEHVFDIDWEDYSIEDKENQSNIIPLFRKSKLKFISDNNILQESKNYLPFRLSSMNKTIIFKTIDDEKSVKFFTRPSRGVFSFNVISKLKTLKILEAMIPINEMTNLSRKMQFYMRVPMGTSPADAFAQARKYELMIKSLLKYESPDDSIDLFKQLLDVRVVPLFGEQNELSEGNIPKPEKVDLSYIDDIRESLVLTTNIPKRFVFPNDESITNPSYLRFLQEIREDTLGEAVRHLVYTYLTKIRENTVDIQFSDVKIKVPKIHGVAELDSIEYIQMFNQTLTDMQSMIKDAADLLDEDLPTLNKKELLSFFNEKFLTFTDKQILQLNEDNEDNEENEGNSYD